MTTYDENLGLIGKRSSKIERMGMKPDPGPASRICKDETAGFT